MARRDFRTCRGKNLSEQNTAANGGTGTERITTVTAPGAGREPIFVEDGN
jgi:hypothetical protein